MRAGGVVVGDIWWRRPAAGACFHYLKTLVCTELREMRMKKPYKNNMLHIEANIITVFHLLSLTLFFS